MLVTLLTNYLEIELVGERREGLINPMKLRLGRKDIVLKLLVRARQSRDSEKYSTALLPAGRWKKDLLTRSWLKISLKKRRQENPHCVI